MTKYILKEKSGAYNLNLYLKVNSKELVWIMNPDKATTFESKEKAKTFRNNNLKETKGVTSLLLSSAQKNWNKSVNSGIPICTAIRFDPKLNEMYDPKKHTPSNVLDKRIEFDLRDREVRYEAFSSWPDLYVVFKCLFSTNAYYEKDNMENLLSSVSIAVNSKLSYETFKRELNIALKRVTYKEDGFKIIGIFDDDLSAHGSTAFYHKNKEYKFVRSFGEPTVFYKLEDAFNFWQKFHIYTRY